MQVRSLESLSKQGGASPILTLIFLGLLAIVLTIAFKLYPAFYEHWQVESVVESFEDESGLGELSEKDINRRFQTRLQTNNIREFNLEDNVLISKGDGLLSIEVDYEVRVNIYRNIDAIMVFQKSFEKRF